jgi:DNA methylase/ParB-like nuclease domain
MPAAAEPKKRTVRAAAPVGRSAPAQWMHPRELRPWAGNPRDNDGEPVDAVAASIKRFGFGAVIVARAKTHEIIAGHTRWKAAKQLKLDRVPVRLLDISEREARLLALADNRLGEFAEWKPPELRELLAGYEADERLLAGWNEKDLRELEYAARGDGGIEDDDVPALPSTPITQPGDLWTLGKHRLVCGDSTDSATVERARGALDPWIMVTDPPYGVEYDPGWKARVGLHAQPSPVVARDLGVAGFELRALIVWSKPHFVIGRGHYHSGHEPCWYAVRGGSSARWCGDRTQSTVWEITRRDGSDETVHSTQKPVECMARPIRNHGAAGDVVYDPFCGSGTTLIAAEQLDRVCVAIDLSPAYCDVIVERWQNLTGGKATRKE